MQKINTSKKTVISSLIWKFLESCGVQFVQFIISIILARLVLPAEYGMVAILSVFIQIMGVFINGGFSTSLIQKKDADNLDFSSIFYFSFVVSIISYFILFFTAPFIASFYKLPLLNPLLKVYAISFVFSSFLSIQGTYVSKNLQFKKLFFSNMSSSIFSGIIGITMAYKGFGVWALVFQQLISSFCTCVILFITVKWRPQLKFSFSRVKSLFSFGWKLLCSSLLDTVFRNIYSLIIGKKYSSTDLALFNKGQSFPLIIANNLDGSVQSVMFPALSANNDDVQKVKQMTRRSITSSAYLLFPCMFGLAAVAHPLVKILLTDKWLPCVPYLQLACISYALWPIHTANLSGINALGRSDIFLKLEIIKKVLTVINLVVTIPLGVLAMAIGQVICGFLSTIINSYPNKKLMNYSYLEQIKDLLPSFIAALIMGVIVWCIGLIKINIFIKLIIQIVTGVFLYISFSKIFKINSFYYLLNTIKEFKNERSASKES